MPAPDQIAKAFPHEPTAQQNELFARLHQFLLSDNGDECFILKGYAGTGKTTVIGALVKALRYYNYKSVLLAPTGRAAKVISAYSGRKAFTIHKRIYRKRSAINIDDPFKLAENLSSDTLFIVDEASMIPDEVPGGNRDALLHDLVNYVYNTKNCKLVLVGDTAQLPPVGADYSPALDFNLLKKTFALDIFSFEL
ncbi:MAG TPA: AAA family ATPase, partial [Mucilaginibacter sp.]|nr:AAA family ATPase [Mucilaginibacter sp.]